MLKTKKFCGENLENDMDIFLIEHSEIRPVNVEHLIVNGEPSAWLNYSTDEDAIVNPNVEIYGDHLTKLQLDTVLHDLNSVYYTTNNDYELLFKDLTIYREIIDSIVSPQTPKVLRNKFDSYQSEWGVLPLEIDKTISHPVEIVSSNSSSKIAIRLSFNDAIENGIPTLPYI